MWRAHYEPDEVRQRDCRISKPSLLCQRYAATARPTTVTAAEPLIPQPKRMLLDIG